MTLTIEDRPLTICQVTQHGLLIPWGRFARYLKLSQRLRAAVPPRRHQDALAGGDLILEFGLASLSGCEYLEDLNLGAHPLAKDQTVPVAMALARGEYNVVIDKGNYSRKPKVSLPSPPGDRGETDR